MANSIRDSFSEFGSELLESIRERHSARLDESAFEEKIIGIEQAVLALREANVEDEKITCLLQKYWDLRLSEAEGFLLQGNNIEKK